MRRKSRARFAALWRSLSEAAVESATWSEQPDSLKPAADKWKLEVKHDHVLREPPPGMPGPLANAKFPRPCSRATRRRTSTTPRRSTSAPASSPQAGWYTPAHRLPLAEVKTRCVPSLRPRRSAGAQGRRPSRRRAPRRRRHFPTTRRRLARPGARPPTVLDAILKAPVATLPAFAGVDLGQQVTWCQDHEALGRDPSVSDRRSARNTRRFSDAVAQAYYAALKARYKVTTNEAALSAVATVPRVELRRGRRALAQFAVRWWL